MEFTNTNDQSEFNSGLSIVFLLHDIKKALIQARLDKDYDARFSLLDEYCSELVAQLPDPEKIKKWRGVEEKQEDYRNKCQKALQKIEETLRLKKNKIEMENIEIFSAWTYSLKKLQQDLGIGMPKKADARYAMGGR